MHDNNLNLIQKTMASNSLSFSGSQRTGLTLPFSGQAPPQVNETHSRSREKKGTRASHLYSTYAWP